LQWQTIFLGTDPISTFATMVFESHIGGPSRKSNRLQCLNAIVQAMQRC
jgi:hypothetical protein